MSAVAPGDAAPKPAVRWLALRRLGMRVGRIGTRIASLCFDAFDIAIKILGPCFIVVAVGIIGFDTYTFFFVLLPVMEDRGVSLYRRIMMSAVGIFLLVNLFFNYFMAIFTDPGLPPEYDSEDLLRTAPEGLDEELGGESAKPQRKQCKKCKRLKPPRTHHCSVCKRCVLKMDHHCPWVNNCVGWRNYRYFCLFLLFLFISCLFVIATHFHIFLETMFHARKSRIKFSVRQSISLSFIVAACITLSMVILGGFHTYLVLTNQTTIEFHSNMFQRDNRKKHGEFYRNPYDLGRSRNFAQVFGPSRFCSFLWLLPYLAPAPAGDGMSFASRVQFAA
eukprot:gnl/TRDRNA2_/TRDRNA2_36643_c0_seq1.p1 gnl/TRDRNA2_/TRDRNA2_36643_c0~~gnl/TRDRNA2_/TRDRNA2_36643_c0_seq1.p1  ORF type:complete len:334 (-),score=38.95 gnl/TRDRNA2_/TRDRNA2_36643_c0_seq1:130-1131(-)